MGEKDSYHRRRFLLRGACPMLNDPYGELDDLRSRMEVSADLDAVLTAAILAASRAIDRACNRAFYQLPGVTRVYSAEWQYELFVDDLVSVSALSTDLDGDRVFETTWQASDYDLDPENAADVSRPYTAIRPRPFTQRWFPTWRRGVQVTGTWGWPAVPDEIAQATLILAQRYVKRADTPLGVVQLIPDSPATNIRATDPDVDALISPYRKFSVVGV